MATCNWTRRILTHACQGNGRVSRILAIYQPDCTRTVSHSNLQSARSIFQCGKERNNSGGSWVIQGLPTTRSNPCRFGLGKVVLSRTIATSPASQPCWKCGREINAKIEQYFCECGVIQPPVAERTFFDVMGVPQTFNMDTALLSKRFRDLQRLLHPDKFTQKSQAERGIADQQSANVNKAYFTLLKPLSRGLYLLELHGMAVEESDIQMEPQFLMEIMEVNESLVQAESIEVIGRIGDKNSEELSHLMEETSNAFEKGDIQQARSILARLKYFANIDEKVKELQMKHAGHY